MEQLEQILHEHRRSIEGYMRFRIRHPADAEDVLQEVYSSAVSGFASLRNTASTRAWLVSIARNKCADYFRRKYRRPEVPMDDDDWQYSRYGRLWTDILPDSEQLIINGKAYIHWYDCITSYIL